MVLKILLFISIILQIIAAVVAIRLIRTTKYNASWVLFSIALTLMACVRLVEFMQSVWNKEISFPPDFFVWIGVFTSLCFATCLILIRKLLVHNTKIERERRLMDRKILNTVLNTEERERMRFSKDLHDGLGPLLSSVKLSVSAIDKTDLTEKQKAIIKNTNYVVDEAVKSIKEISNNLSPNVLNSFGLHRAISNFIDKLPIISETKINFADNLKDKRFSTEIEIIVYRVVCELINNSLKHAEASEINLRVIHYNDRIKIEFSDNGKGFDVEKELKENKGMGLSNITSRISSIKGVAEIKSETDRGMTATIIVNISESK